MGDETVIFYRLDDGSMTMGVNRYFGFTFATLAPRHDDRMTPEPLDRHATSLRAFLRGLGRRLSALRLRLPSKAARLRSRSPITHNH